MDLQERCTQLVVELINGIDAGDLDNMEEIPAKYTYGHLEALFLLSDALDNGKQLYEQVYTIFTAYGRRMIKKKMRSGQKIKLAFLAISAAEWPAEQVYRILKQDERIECYVVVSPLEDRDYESRKDTYTQTYHFFQQNGFDVRGGYDAETDTCMPWSALGGMPDIVIHLTPWYRSLPEIYRISSFPVTCVNCYIPYGIYAGNSADGAYIKYITYNNVFLNLMWRIYADSTQNMEGYREYGLLHGQNTAYSGYVKMDHFYCTRNWDEEEIRKIWKIPEGKRADEMKRIIIAPHHSILGYGGIKFSTFQKNAHFLLYLAQKYQDEVTFVFKPHPNLRLRAVEAGVFESYEAYDTYLAKWNALPNARVVQEASYLDVFDTSDGMIMDSISFLGEYMYVNKPLLFLRRDGQAFNKLGEKVINGYYTERGEDYSGIEKFLQDVIINGNDTKKAVREEIWRNEFDYVKINQCTASEYVYRDICSLL